MHEELLQRLTPKPLREFELPNPFSHTGFTARRLGEEAGFWAEGTRASGARKHDTKKTRELINQLLKEGRIRVGDKERTMQCGSKPTQVYHVV